MIPIIIITKTIDKSVYLVYVIIMDKYKANGIIKEFMILTEKIASGGKVPKPFGTDIFIYRREIHTLMLIYDNPEIHISEIARSFNITKGAVSKTIKTLEQKGLLEKYPDETNQSRTLSRLTPKGITACKEHLRMHEEIDGELYTFLDSLSPHDVEIITAFLKKANELSDRHI